MRIRPVTLDCGDVTISVVVCAYTTARHELLKMSLDSVIQQLGANDQLIVVIDHNDQLLDVVSKEYGSLANVIPNTNDRGLCGARNSGVEAASKSIVAFIDDDAQIGEGWLASLRNHYGDPVVTGVGGSAQPVWPRERPSWFPCEFDWVVGCSHQGLPVDVSAVRNLLGCNMSFRRIALNQAGGFSTEIGQVGTNLVRCDETELCIRLKQLSPFSQLLFDPRITVKHWVSHDRTRLSYFVKRCFFEGLSKHRLSTMVGSSDALSAERKYVSAILPKALIRGLIGFVTSRGERLHHLSRVTAIIIGFTATSGGYIYSLTHSRFSGDR
jgi:glycosyltransferase involved in cell wall biosynthesis